MAEAGMTGRRLASIGECMVELSHRDATTLGLAYGGDTLNTALYLARCNTPARLAVDYVTALGPDPYSDEMLALWRREGIGTAGVARLPGKLPGLYLIRTDAAGERRFFYYRSAAAVRELFHDPATEPLLAMLPGYDILYFSAVTLSVLSPVARDRFRAALGAARAAGRAVVLDTNYRPAGWPDRAAAQREVLRFLPCVSLALPTFDDEQALFGDADPAATAARYARHGVPLTVIKRGPEGCLLVEGTSRREVPVPRRIVPVDTTAAGDAFNAGFLSARLAGRDPAAAAQAGHILAAAVIGHRGAIIPRAAMPDLGL